MVFLTVTSWWPGLTPSGKEEANTLQNMVLIGALATIAVGTGGIKPNVSAFGADQFDVTNPQVRSSSRQQQQQQQQQDAA